MFWFSVISIRSVIAEIQREQKYIKSLPEKEKAIYLENKKREFEENEKHRKALEIAEAGRPRNFWGK